MLVYFSLFLGFSYLHAFLAVPYLLPATPSGLKEKDPIVCRYVRVASPITRRSTARPLLSALRMEFSGSPQSSIDGAARTSTDLLALTSARLAQKPAPQPCIQPAKLPS